MGMPQAEIARKFDAIVEFAGVEDFISTPVKRYSSGMNARLGFAIAAHFDPDVLLIDEVLSVGDVSFQAKCMARMRALIKNGVPLVFVSHNLTAVVDLCTRAILIERFARRWVYTAGATALAVGSAFFVTQSLPGQMLGMLFRVMGASALSITLNLYIMDHIRKTEFMQAESLRMTWSMIAWTCISRISG